MSALLVPLKSLGFLMGFQLHTWNNYVFHCTRNSEKKKTSDTEKCNGTAIQVGIPSRWLRQDLHSLNLLTYTKIPSLQYEGGHSKQLLFTFSFYPLNRSLWQYVLGAYSSCLSWSALYPGKSAAVAVCDNTCMQRATTFSEQIYQNAFRLVGNTDSKIQTSDLQWNAQ